MRATVWCLLLLPGLLSLSAAESNSTTLAWQSANPIQPANFEAYFPDDADATKRLPERPVQTVGKTNLAEWVQIIRQGLRRAQDQQGNEWIRWLGQQCAWNAQADLQDPHAIELLYHASAHTNYQYNALYYGLSRLERKPPALLRRMVEIAMRSDDWINVVGHTAWATEKDRDATLVFLGPYLTSTQPAVRAHAEAVKRIYTGEITAQAYWKQVHTERATAEFGRQMDTLRQRFKEGDSQARRELLATIQQHALGLIMDEGWIDAYAAAAADPDSRVRRDVAAQIGAQWFWERKPSDPINQRALDLLLKMSRDADRDVRHNVRYFGLDRMPENKPVQTRLREMEKEDVERELMKMREHALAAIERGQFEPVESLLHELRPGTNGNVPEGTRLRVAEFVKEIETRLAEGRRPHSDLQRQIDQAAAGTIIDLAPGRLDGPVLIEKELTLRGAGSDQTIITYRGDQPAVMIRGARRVRLENLTVHWAPRSTDAKTEYPAAVAVRDADVVLQSVALRPLDRPHNTPYGLMAAGRADVQFVAGESRGFAYALIWQEGASGRVTDSDLRDAGHSVVTVHPGSEVEVARNLLADCGYHAVRVTGGTVDMHDNIVMGCKRAGAYLGNKDAHGRIYQNLFTGNLGEIWGYYGSDVTIDHNLFYRSKDSAIIFWNTCALVVRSNSFVANPAALRQYVQANDPAKLGVQLDGNHYWANQEPVQPGRKIGAEGGVDERFRILNSANAIEGDPQFRGAASGDFTPLPGSALLRDNQPAAGLSNPQAIANLARRHHLQFPP